MATDRDITSTNDVLDLKPFILVSNMSVILAIFKGTANLYMLHLEINLQASLNMCLSQKRAMAVSLSREHWSLEISFHIYGHISAFKLSLHITFFP